MSRLNDRLLNHPVRGSINDLRATVAGLNEEAVAAVEEVSEGTLERVPVAMTYIEGALAAAHPQLVTASSLEALDAAVTNANNTAAQLATTPAVATTLDTYVEGALDAVASLVAATPLLQERAGEAGETLSTALTETVQAVKAKAEQLDADLDAVEQERTEAETARVAADAERTATVEAEAAALTALVTVEKQRLDTLVPNFETQFTDAEEARQATFDALQETLQAQSETVVTDLKTAFEETVTGLTDSSTKVLSEVEDRRAEVEKLHGVITDTSTTGAFRKEATEQKKAADTWRRVTVVFGSIAAALAVAAVVLATIYPDRATSTSAVIAKITVTLAAAGVAAYAGRQSGRHRQREEESKRLELELVAFPPFIESLEEDQRREVRKEFADRAFRVPRTRF